MTTPPPPPPPPKKKPGILVEGIVAQRNAEPYVVIWVNGERAQLDIASARKVAADIVQTAARTEADAMIHRFFTEQNFPEGANVAIMLAFREFRIRLDAEPVEGFLSDPDKGEGPLQ